MCIITCFKQAETEARLLVQYASVPCVAFVVQYILRVESLVLVQLLAKLLARILVLVHVGQDCP